MSGLYYRCPTCRTCLADKQLVYEQEHNKIISNHKMRQHQKDAAVRELLDNIFLDKKENMCCRARIMTYMHQTEIIV